MTIGLARALRTLASRSVFQQHQQFQQQSQQIQQ
jgi:hypothetical protein